MTWLIYVAWRLLFPRLRPRIDVILSSFLLPHSERGIPFSICERELRIIGVAASALGLLPLFFPMHRGVTLTGLLASENKKGRVFHAFNGVQMGGKVPSFHHFQVVHRAPPCLPLMPSELF